MKSKNHGGLELRGRDEVNEDEPTTVPQSHTTLLGSDVT